MNSITSRDLFNIFLKNIFIILLSAIIFSVGAYVYCENFTDKKFMAQGEILVTNGNIGDKDDSEDEIIDDSTESTPESTPETTVPNSGPVNNTDIAASINLLPTVRSMLTGSGIYKEFANYLNTETEYNYSYSQLKAAAKVDQTEKQSFYIGISFELGSREDAIAITNHFLEFVPSYFEGKIHGSRVSTTPDCDTAVQTAPRTMSTVALAAIVGVVLSYGVVFLISILNSTIKSDEDFSARYNIPVIGNIPDFSISHSNSKPTSKKGKRG